MTGESLRGRRCGDDDAVPDVGLDEQLELDRLAGDVTDGVGEHPGVARADPFGGERARHRQHQHVVRELDRTDTVEPGGPRCRRELRAESGSSLVPDFVGRHGAPPSSVHRSVHRCGDRWTSRARRPQVAPGCPAAVSPCRPGRAREGPPGKFANGQAAAVRGAQRSTRLPCPQGPNFGSQSGPRRREPREPSPHCAWNQAASTLNRSSPPARNPHLLRARPPRGGLSFEAHLPTQQSQAQQDSRLPRPDADARRASGPARSSGPRPEASLRLIWRIRDRASFEALARARRRKAGPVTLRFVHDEARRCPSARLVRGGEMGGFGRCAQPHPPPPPRRRGTRGGRASAGWPLPLRRRPRCGGNRIHRARGRGRGAGARRRGVGTMSRPRGSVPARVVMLPIRGWRLISRHLPPRCRFYPSCSQYALDALASHGAARGSWLALRRIGRCHPWHEGGLDPVPEPNVRSHSRQPVAVATEES